MIKLETIQIQENFNEVFVADEIEPGEVNQKYQSTLNNGENAASDVVVIKLQKGQRKEVALQHAEIASS